MCDIVTQIDDVQKLAIYRRSARFRAKADAIVNDVIAALKK